MKRMIEELIMLADILDASGFKKEAMEIDDKAAQYGIYNVIVEFVRKLRIGFEAAARGDQSSITEDQLPDIYRAIDEVVRFVTPEPVVPPAESEPPLSDIAENNE